MNSPTYSDTPSKRPPTPAKDLEYGIPHPPPQQAGSPTASYRTSKPSEFDASRLKAELPWNEAHPCFPHPNPHVPLASPLYSSTRVIRIPRDWMIVGDLAPTFSNTYPQILEPWVSEDAFRLLIEGINERLIAAFSPEGWRAWLDAVLGFATGWIYEDMGFSKVKKGVRDTERFIEEWNGQRKAELEKDDDAELVRAIPLVRTGYTCLDIQIPDPQVGVTAEEDAREVNGHAPGADDGRKI